MLEHSDFHGEIGEHGSDFHEESSIQSANSSIHTADFGSLEMRHWRVLKCKLGVSSSSFHQACSRAALPVKKS